MNNQAKSKWYEALQSVSAMNSDECIAFMDDMFADMIGVRRARAVADAIDGMVDEDPLPQGYVVHWHYDTCYAMSINGRSDDNSFSTHTNLKSAVRWCWAHSQGLV